MTIGLLDSKTAKILLAEYGEELYQLKYNSVYEPVRMQLATKLVKAKSEDARILQKVADFTVKEPIHARQG